MRGAHLISLESCWETSMEAPTVNVDAGGLVLAVRKVAAAARSGGIHFGGNAVFRPQRRERAEVLDRQASPATQIKSD